MRFNEGMEHSDFMTMLAIAKEIGIENGKDLQRFKKEEVKEGESLVDAILRYRDELGKDFKIEEDVEASEWRKVDSKTVRDTDGFATEYTWYRRKDDDGNDIHIMMLGDSDIYEPDEAYADAVFNSEEDAEEWFYTWSSDEDDEYDTLDEAISRHGETRS